LKDPLLATVAGFLLEMVHFSVTMQRFKIWDRQGHFHRSL